MDFTIKHDQAAHKFFAIIDGKEAFMEYSIKDDKTLDYCYTFVPSELRGQQIAEKIVKAALNYARDNHYKVIPSCPYVQRIIDANPEYESLLT